MQRFYANASCYVHFLRCMNSSSDITLPPETCGSGSCPFVAVLSAFLALHPALPPHPHHPVH